jgi:hypothetical protein
MTSGVPFGDLYETSTGVGANNIPTFTIKHIDGDVKVLSGRDAIVAADPARYMLSGSPKDMDAIIASHPEDARNAFSYSVGRWLADKADGLQPSFVGRILNNGPLAGGASGAAAGALGGYIADKILDKINGGPRDSKVNMALLGGLGLGGLGALLGYVRKSIGAGTPATYTPASIAQYLHDSSMSDRPVDYLVKKSAMYKDPRNFILEKLQGAHDVSFSDKAKLAAAVRNLGQAAATKLAEMVRSAVGFGVGALIAKFIFGINGLKGTAVGGIVGLMGAGLVNSMLRARPASSNNGILGSSYYNTRR